MDEFKIKKLRSLTDEVDELHPLLRSVFSNNHHISRFEYTHGAHEMGADFVLARSDQMLGDENYVGVIVKRGNINQDHSDIKRQIEECAIERFFDGGIKKIHINEVWIICNGKISNGAERKIHEEYKSSNVKFVDVERLAQLVDNYYPGFWVSIPASLDSYLRATLIEATKEESYCTLSPGLGAIDLMQELYEVEPVRPGNKIPRYNKSRRTTLTSALESKRFIVVEGGMGSGKTTLLRRHVIGLCDQAEFFRNKTIPKTINYSDISDEPIASLSAIVESLSQTSIDDKSTKILLIIDGIDEVRCATNGSLVTVVKKIFDYVKISPNISVVMGSRPIWSIEEGEEILNYCPRYKILPLSFDQIIKVVQHNCKSIGISDRLRQDLSRSALMRAIPRTPMSAILLAKVLEANVKEVPQTLPELYSKYVELALGRWDITKGLMTEREYPVIVTVLSRVAKYMLENELHMISISEVYDMFSDYSETREGIPSADEIFSRIEERAEVVIINRAKGTFSFRHRSISEFLLAYYQKENFGRNAPLSNPFSGYWLGVEYFYLGLIQDAGERIDSLSSLVLPEERDKFLRILNFGSLMLSSYQTEYTHIEKSVYRLFIEATKHFQEVREGLIQSKLSSLPEIQFFAMLSYSLRDGFEYTYFKKALEIAQIQCQCDQGLKDEERTLCSFLIDCVRAGLKEPDAFTFLTSYNMGDLPWVVRLGIQHVMKDDNINHEHLLKFYKRVEKSKKRNPSLRPYLKELYEGSMNKTDRKLISRTQR